RVIEAIHRLDDLRVVQAMAAGVDWLLDAIPTGVTLCDGAGVHDVPVAEWVVMMTLAAYHNLPTYVDAQRTGRWHRAGIDAGGVGAAGGLVAFREAARRPPGKTRTRRRRGHRGASRRSSDRSAARRAGRDRS